MGIQHGIGGGSFHWPRVDAEVLLVVGLVVLAPLLALEFLPSVSNGDGETFGRHCRGAGCWRSGGLGS